jgi:sec-independent protein translocase protein TatA
MEPCLATFGIWELVVILLIVVVIFGAARLPQLGGAMGKAIRNFRKSFKGEPREVKGEARRVEEGKQAGQLPAAQSETLETEESREEATADRE